MPALTIDDATDALVVVDVQNDFCPEGALAVPKGDEVVPVANRLIQRFAHVLLTQDWHPPGHRSFASGYPGKKPFETTELAYGTQVLWPDHCVQGTEGADFHWDLEDGKAELIIRKGFRPDIDSYSAFFENDRRTPTGLSGYLRTRGFNRDRLLRPLLGRRRRPAGFRGRGSGGWLPGDRPRRIAGPGEDGDGQGRSHAHHIDGARPVI
jgi:nicotinamidase/pyrazinamidase